MELTLTMHATIRSQPYSIIRDLIRFGEERQVNGASSDPC